MRQTVTSRQNASVKLAASLHQKKYRDETGLIWLEGERNLSALPEDVKVRFWVSTEPDSLQEKENVIVVEPSIFGYISGLKTPQGMGAVLERPPEEDISSLTEGNILFLERVQNPDNVGAIIRSAACAGFSHVVLSEGLCGKHLQGGHLPLGSFGPGTAEGDRAEACRRPSVGG